ncbi:MAG: MFS transporter [Dehalococcoidales bacterium]|nr:MFS transporter [Dehalococcoidales bacterium]
MSRLKLEDCKKSGDALYLVMANLDPDNSGRQADLAAGKPAVAARGRFSVSDRAEAGTIIGSHTMTHVYGHGFYVIIPEIYRQLGLVPLQAGLIDTVRSLCGGLGSMLVGFIVDIYKHRRGLFLGLSIMTMGVGYFLVSVAPNYALILMALALASIGNAMWHPPGLGLLSERYPRRRGLLIALHRSSGSVGDTLSPPLVGFLLVAITWQQTLQAALPLAILLSVVLWVLLWNVGGSRVQHGSLKSNLQNYATALREAGRDSGLLTLLLVSGVRGMGDRGLFLFIPLYLAQNLEMSTIGIGFHLGLLTFLGIASGPVIGAISDRIGRKPMIILVLFMSAIFPPLMVMSGAGIGLTISIALFGVFLYSINSLVQAAAMDVAEGKKLEGTLIGLLWGNNALFSAASPILAGALAGIFGFQAAFYYAAVMFFAGGLLAFRLPVRKIPQP